MKKKFIILVSVLLLAVLLLAGCAAGANPSMKTLDDNGKSAGFWSGLWHGCISPVTFVISLFSDNVSLYDVHNSGNWYDFGFIIGLSIVFGGGACGGACRKRRKSD